MRNWHPYSPIRSRRCREPASAGGGLHRCRASAAIRAARAAKTSRRRAPGLACRTARCRGHLCAPTGNHVLFVDANAQCVSSASRGSSRRYATARNSCSRRTAFPNRWPPDIPTAQFEETARLVAERAWPGGVVHRLSESQRAPWRSWLGPDVCDHLRGARARHRGGDPQSDWLRLRPRRSALRPRRRSPASATRSGCRWSARRRSTTTRFLDMMDVVLRVCNRTSTRARSNWCLRHENDSKRPERSRWPWQSRQPWARRCRRRDRARGLTAVSGLKVGHHTLTEPAGCTVVLAEKGATAGVDVRGSAPGCARPICSRRRRASSRCTRSCSVVGAPVSTLQAASCAISKSGCGFKFGGSVVPIVPAAILFDLPVGDGRIRPGADCMVFRRRRRPPTAR